MSIILGKDYLGLENMMLSEDEAPKITKFQSEYVAPDESVDSPEIKGIEAAAAAGKSAASDAENTANEAAVEAAKGKG